MSLRSEANLKNCTAYRQVRPTKLDTIKNLHNFLHTVAIIGYPPFVTRRLAEKPAGNLPRKMFNRQLCWFPATVRPSGTMELRSCATAANGAGIAREHQLVHHGAAMCGRYSMTADLGELALRFEFDGDRLTFQPTYNVAPTQEVLTVVGGETRRGGFMRWGLIPHWAKGASNGSRMINARAETVGENPAFRDALRRRRCLVLADGFYEWQRVGRVKRPMRVVMRSGDPFAFAGLWSVWRDPAGNAIPSCTIVTTAANDLLRPIHDRMPLVLPSDMEGLWLDRGVDDPIALADVLSPHLADTMDTYEVSALVNSVANDGPEVIEAVVGPASS